MNPTHGTPPSEPAEAAQPGELTELTPPTNTTAPAPRPRAHARPRTRGASVLTLAGALSALAAALALTLAAAALGARLAAWDTGELRIPAAGTTSVLRTALFGALAVVIGERAGVRFAGAGPLPGSWSRPAALVGAAAAAGQIAVLAAVNGLDLATAAYASREGRLLLLTANGLLAVAACVPRRPRLALAPLAVAILAESLRAHPEPYTPEIGTALTVVHLTAASLWCGGLLYALRVMAARRRDGTGALAVLGRYARTAVWPLLALTATGTASTLRRLPTDVVLTSAYGRVLIAKLVLVAVVCALAFAARRAMLRGRFAARSTAWRELAVLALVLLVSALLTVVPDPHWISTRLSLR
ncbi:CopD family protein [Streptomyces sp. NPDC057638]|uniref:CopD family protein n=1 Tax=Streptomyces sp. NPDC057638 TaxID=3346190 RepID=UPI0036812D66